MRPVLASASASATSLVAKDLTGPAISFFYGIRVPAALLAASAIKDAFVLQGPPQDIAKSNPWRLLRYAYLILMVGSFALEMSTIFMATHVGVQLQSGSSDFSRELGSLIDLLVREVEYEYVAVRCQFVTGMLAYVVAQGLRVRYAPLPVMRRPATGSSCAWAIGSPRAWKSALTHTITNQALRRYSELALCAMFAMFGTAAGMLTYNNLHSITYGGFPGLFRRWIELTARMLCETASPSLRRPMPLITITCLLLALAFALRSLGGGAVAFAAALGRRRTTANGQGHREGHQHSWTQRLRPGV